MALSRGHRRITTGCRDNPGVATATRDIAMATSWQTMALPPVPAAVTAHNVATASHSNTRSFFFSTPRVSGSNQPTRDWYPEDNNSSIPM